MQLHVYSDDIVVRERISGNSDSIMRLARVEQSHTKRSAHGSTPDGGLGAEGPSLTVVVDKVSYKLPLTGIIDVDAEKARLRKAAEGAEKERDSLAARLANPSFTERAKPEAVEKARSDHAEKSAEAERYRAALERLG